MSENTTTGHGERTVVLRMTDVSRSFGETKALTAASIEVREGEIHTLAGENGSGKSTLLKILSGVVQKDGGEIRWHDDSVDPRGPAAARELGISTVFQETLVVPEMSVVDNIFLKSASTFRRGAKKEFQHERAVETLADLGLPHLKVTQPMWSLSLAERQVVTIARAIARPWQLLVLDEATSALDADQRDQLFAYLQQERSLGKSVLFTSHRMDEVELIADAVTVLRLGASVHTSPLSQTSPPEILRMMAGQKMAAAAEATPRTVTRRPSDVVEDRAAVMEVRGLVLREGSKPIDLTVHAGEIVGLAGLEGQGQLDFVRCLSGSQKPVKGSIRVIDRQGDPTGLHGLADANRKGVAFVPRDRRHEGLFDSMSILDNFSFGIAPRLSRLGILDRHRIKQEFLRYAKLTNLRYRSANDEIGTLSGGNQQKVLLARWLATSPRLLVLNDPFRGVDANTKEELYQLVTSLLDDGLAIVLVSSEVLELLTLCEHVAVFHEASVSAFLKSVSSTDADVVAAMFGHTPEVGINV